MKAERTNPRLVVALLALIVLAVVVTAIFHRPDAHFLAKHGDIGTIDFIQYWSSRQLLVRGENPYDPALLYAIETSLVVDGASPEEIEASFAGVPKWAAAR